MGKITPLMTETPDGVDDFLDLPIFKRMKKSDLKKFMEKRRKS